MDMVFKMGDKVWYANAGVVEKSVICPECFGKLYLTVILGDDSKVTIDCAGCSRGMQPSTGRISYYEWKVDVKEVTVERIEIKQDGVTYGFWNHYCADNDKIFSTKEEAEKRALELVEEHNKEELEKIYRKEKNNRTWSWNAYYHRDCIRRAEKDLIYHNAKLNAAKLKAKEDKKVILLPHRIG